MSKQNECEITVVTTTAPTEEVARRLAQAALNAKLAVCVQVEPITSHYWWRGELCEEVEQRLTFKTLEVAWGPLQALLEAEHPYQVPQLTAIKMIASRAYFTWAKGEIDPELLKDA